MPNYYSKLTIVVVLLLALLMPACTQNQVLTLLNNVVTTSEALLPAIASSTGLDPQVQATIKKYLDGVSAASAAASEILAGTGTSAQKATQIAAAFAGISVPILPAGTPQKVATLVLAVAQAVASLLSNLQTAPTSPPAQVTSSARARLASMQDRALTVQETVSGGPRRMRSIKQ